MHVNPTLTLRNFPGFPTFPPELSFPRSTVILGANGTGKSRLLRQVVTQLRNTTKIFYVEGARQLEFPVRIDHSEANIEEVFHHLRPGMMAKRITEGLTLLERTTTAQKIKHSGHVTDWQKGGESGPSPVLDEPPLDKVRRVFHEIFPKLTLEFEDTRRSLTCYRDGSKYHPNELSDGEKQILGLLIDVFCGTNGISMVLIDEPELNLNASLAQRVWDLIELEMSDVSFVYATHSIAFAMGCDADQIVVLSSTGLDATIVTDFSEVPRTEIREFLGSAPAILSSAQTLVVEGTEGSIDRIIYGWLLPSVVVVSVEGSQTVISAARGSGLWSKLAVGATLVGAIDRDHLPPHNSSDALVVLDLHEIESYLCIPELFCEVSKGVGTLADEDIPTPKQVSEEIVRYAKKHGLRITATRILAKLRLNFDPSLSKRTLSKLSSETELRNEILGAAAAKVSRLQCDCDANAVNSSIDRELEAITTAAAEQDIKRLLELLPGKELLNELLRTFRLPKPKEFARAATRHADVRSHTLLKQLQQRLASALGV